MNPAKGETLATSASIHAGAAAVDISPRRLPVIQNGGFISKVADRVAAPLYARSLVVRNEGESMAIVIVDSCMIPRDVCVGPSGPEDRDNLAEPYCWFGNRRRAKNSGSRPIIVGRSFALAARCYRRIECHGYRSCPGFETQGVLKNERDFSLDCS